MDFARCFCLKNNDRRNRGSMSNTIEVNDFVYIGNIGRGRKDRGKICKGGWNRGSVFTKFLDGCGFVICRVS